jgi:hypothetical protein
VKKCPECGSKMIRWYESDAEWGGADFTGPTAIGWQCRTCGHKEYDSMSPVKVLLWLGLCVFVLALLAFAR